MGLMPVRLILCQDKLRDSLGILSSGTRRRLPLGRKAICDGQLKRGWSTCSDPWEPAECSLPLALLAGLSDAVIYLFYRVVVIFSALLFITNRLRYLITTVLLGTVLHTTMLIHIWSVRYLSICYSCPLVLTYPASQSICSDTMLAERHGAAHLLETCNAGMRTLVPIWEPPLALGRMSQFWRRSLV